LGGVTMRDVARKAGVSAATVSYVLSGKDSRISEATRKRVMAAAQALDYTPNSIARSLAAQATWTIGLVVADVVRAPFSSAIKGVEGAAMRFGYNVILCNTDSDPERLLRSTEVLAAKRVDGVVYVLSSRCNEQLPVDRLFRYDIPVVLVNRLSSDVRVPSVLIDNVSGTFDITQQLLEMGHRRIACIHLPMEGPGVIQASRDRLTGFQKAHQCLGVAMDAQLLRTGAFGEEIGEEVGYRRSLELLDLDERPTAIVCCNDYLAIGALRACRARGLVVPDDVAVVGHDNISASRYVSPALTSIDQPMAEAGSQAAQLLVQLMWERGKERRRGGPPPTVEVTADMPSTVIRLPCSVMLRASSGHTPR
jgi:LacI family transcriptional regulator